MVEYTVDTLVKLYDSLNSEIEKIHADLSASYQYDINLVDDHARAELEKAIKCQETRLNKLAKMRDNIEDILDRIFAIEVQEVK